MGVASGCERLRIEVAIVLRGVPYLMCVVLVGEIISISCYLLVLTPPYT